MIHMLSYAVMYVFTRWVACIRAYGCDIEALMLEFRSRGGQLAFTFYSVLLKICFILDRSNVVN